MNLRSLTDQELVNRVLHERAPDDSLEYQLAERLQRALDEIAALQSEAPACGHSGADSGDDS